jgi:hypothetical protein
VGFSDARLVTVLEATMQQLTARTILVLTLVSVGTALAARTQPSDVVVHEWGTFTTVAAEDGSAVQWLPLGGQNDLPCFVNRFQNNSLLKWVGTGAPLTYNQARTNMRGTVRMETPVLYFYTPREAVLDVSVRFPQGLITEWYPKAAVTQPPLPATVPSTPGQSLIQWSGVRVVPRSAPALPREPAPSHYYAARATDAAPLRVGGQSEKFLFYRGIGGFQVPVSAVLTEAGTIRVSSGAARVPHLVLFENRGGRIGYRIHAGLQGETAFDPPELTGDVASLARELEGMLVSSGLYAREAQAMVATWRDSWFEEGTRLFYILPAAAVDSVLPLTISPAPARVARAFVGRMEIVTPATMCAVRDAIAQDDASVLNRYGRFLGPIADRLLATASPAERARTQAVLESHYRAVLKQVTSACN